MSGLGIFYSFQSQQLQMLFLICNCIDGIINGLSVLTLFLLPLIIGASMIGFQVQYAHDSFFLHPFLKTISFIREISELVTSRNINCFKYRTWSVFALVVPLYLITFTCPVS
jgi:hypothetical protein